MTATTTKETMNHEQRAFGRRELQGLSVRLVSGSIAQGPSDGQTAIEHITTESLEGNTVLCPNTFHLITLVNAFLFSMPIHESFGVDSLPQISTPVLRCY